jgi:branched-chain amino acid transport system substrate-binding protein
MKARETVFESQTEDSMKSQTGINRRRFLTQSGLLTATAVLPGLNAWAQAKRLRVGLMLPYTGTYAQLGAAITNGFKLAVTQRGGKLGGRELEFFTVDDEADPAKAPENTNKLVQRDKVDVLVGTVHSGVQMGMVKIAKETNTLLIIPNAGLDAATGALCAPHIFRSSFSNWQPSYPMGKVLADRGIRNVVSLAWKYGAGEEAVAGFTEGFIKAGGKTVRGLWIPFPNVEFQALLTEIASLKPDAVFVFFAGAGAAKFIKDYAAAGLRKTIPLFGSGFLTDGILDAVDNAAEGLETTLHYADGLNSNRDKEFRAAYTKAHKIEPDVYAVQGYDAALLLAVGLEAVKGDIARRKEMIAAMEKTRIDSPRGAWTLSKSHNPIQDIYLRKVIGRENRFVSVAHKALADPARGCKM